MNRRLWVVFLLGLLILAAAVQPRSSAALFNDQRVGLSSTLTSRVYAPAVYVPPAAPPSLPRLLAEVNGSGKGRVWVGATPANSETKPVVVFVHGLHGSAQSWWGTTGYSGVNDMYYIAYGHGYRTAFVSLDDETGGPASTMWVNGATLNRQLDVILKHFGVTSVNIIAHSKGGVDANSAVIHSGASSKVQNIVTLGSPHHGSELADLAYSWWAEWLSALLGQRDDGTYVLQTSYMRHFRSLTDPRSENADVRFWTAGGTNHGPWFTSLWYGGNYLSRYGPNDGLVTVASSYHPREYRRLFTADLNHDNIRKGSAVWSDVEPAVHALWRTTPPTSTEELAPASVAAGEAEPSNLILRGGQLSEPFERLRLLLEAGVRRITFDLLSNRSDLEVTVVDPQGRRYQADAPVPNADVFRGAFHHMTTLPAPEMGEWTVELQGDAGTAYLLVTTVDSPLEVTVTRAAGVLPEQQIDVEVRAQAHGQPAPEVVVAVQLTGTSQTPGQSGHMNIQRHVGAQGQGSVTAQLTAPEASGLYGVGITVTGAGPDGSRFERSFPENVAVLPAVGAQSPPLRVGR